MISRQTSLSGNVVQFCRFLRQHEFSLSAEEEATALKILKFVDYSSPAIFREALKAVLCRSQKQLANFDSLFEEYWRKLAIALDSKVKTKDTSLLKPQVNGNSFKALKSWLHGRESAEIEHTASYSIHQNLTKQDFSQVPAGEREELFKIIKALAKRLAAQANRRLQKCNKINRPDLGNTLRTNLRNGGELIKIAYQKPKRNRVKLVIICDTSKSMELYSAFLLQFLYTFHQAFNRVETFAFSTSLQCISPNLNQPDFGQALLALSAQNTNWRGGTKIGECLHTFLKEFGNRLLTKRTLVIIMSDGWDTGDLPLLGKSLATIKAKSKKIIWLNPLAGFAAYQPEVAGMQAALPYIDVLAPVHNVESLRKLGKCLFRK